MRLKLNSGDLSKQVREASQRAVQATLEEAANTAKTMTPVDTGFLRNTMEVTRDATVQGTKVNGSFGNTTAEYAIFVETGTRGRPGVHMIRRAADQEFPKLMGRIRKEVG